MFKYCKILIKYLFGSSALLFLLKSLLTQKPEINFLREYPDIKPEKCLKTSPFIGGDMRLVCVYMRRLKIGADVHQYITIRTVHHKDFESI